jgi:signal transduction histidine kinase
MENLLSNAIKFSPSDKSIFFNLYDKGDHIIGEVRDEGPGLSEDDKKKLFSKYQKLSAKPTGNESSTGLGLSIVKKFTESMHGQIWCESEPNNGASFYVKFNKTFTN